MQPARPSRGFTRRGFVTGLMFLALWRAAPVSIQPRKPENEDGFVEVDGWILLPGELA